MQNSRSDLKTSNKSAHRTLEEQQPTTARSNDALHVRTGVLNKHKSALLPTALIEGNDNHGKFRWLRVLLEHDSYHSRNYSCLATVLKRITLMICSCNLFSGYLF